jgi:hypothetical protein
LKISRGLSAEGYGVSREARAKKKLIEKQQKPRESPRESKEERIFRKYLP